MPGAEPSRAEHRLHKRTDADGASSPLTAAKLWIQDNICVHNNSGVTVLVSVACVENVTTTTKANGEIEGSATGGKVGGGYEKVPEKEKAVSQRALEDGDRHNFTLAVGNKAYVTIATIPSV